MPRLNQVTKELNIGYHTAADFLRRRFGADVELNDKISDAQYAALAEEFYRDMVEKNSRKRTMKVKSKNYHEMGFGSAAELKIKKSGGRIAFPNMSKNARIISIPFGGRNKKR